MRSGNAFQVSKSGLGIQYWSMARFSWEDAGGEFVGGGGGVIAPVAPRIRAPRDRVPDLCPPFEPPFDFGDSGDSGDGGGWGDGSPDENADDDGPSRDIATFGLGLALIGIVTIFAIFLLAWFLLRRSVPEAPAALSTAPPALWLATACLLSSSLLLQSAVDRSTDDVRGAARRSLGWSIALGGGFLLAQAWLWTRLWTEGFLPSTGGYGSVFYALTGLHAVHVLAGLSVLAWLWLRTRSAEGLRPGRLRLGALYWHAMGGIWVVLFLTLYVGR